MLHSEERTLTTHVGSLRRSVGLSDLLMRRENGEAMDGSLLAAEIEKAVREVMRKQYEVGLDIGNDGEQPRVAFNTYVARRMKGFGGQGKWTLPRDVTDYPDFLEVYRSHRSAGNPPPQAIAEIEYVDLSEAEAECNLAWRAAGDPPLFRELFMTAASPGVIATALGNAYYDTHERYVSAIARQMQKEYELIHAKGFVLQLDCPDLAMERVRMFADAPLSRFQAVVEMHIDAINQATANIPAGRIRLHVCWGNYEGPHTHDVALEAILPLLYQAKVGALSIEMANPRHAHEYTAFKRFPMPGHLLFLPGVIDTTTNFVEHPELVAQRIEQAVDAVGDRSRVIASADCGFGTFSGWQIVAPSLVWAKLGSLTEGARIASSRLW